MIDYWATLLSCNKNVKENSFGVVVPQLGAGSLGRFCGVEHEPAGQRTLTRTGGVDLAARRPDPPFQHRLAARPRVAPSLDGVEQYGRPDRHVRLIGPNHDVEVLIVGNRSEELIRNA